MIENLSFTKEEAATKEAFEKRRTLSERMLSNKEEEEKVNIPYKLNL